MKKLVLIILLITGFHCVLSAQNNKFGHISPEEIMEMMPGFDTAQNSMIEYQNEYQKEGEEMLKELQLKQQEFDNNAGTYSSAVRKVKEEELRAMYARIQEFSSTIEANIQQKKYELLLPFQTKIIDAIKEVAKEGNFAYIFNKSLLTYYQQGEDITEKVKQKLGIVQ